MHAQHASFHSIMLRADAEALLDNHRIYCQRWGYEHIRHAIGSPHNSPRTLLVYKYSVMFHAVTCSPPGALLIFADDDAAIYSPIAAHEVIGDATHWIVENAQTHRPEGNFFMLRAGHPATAMIEGILERLRTMPDAGVDRWSHIELEGVATQAHDALLDGRHFPNLLFAPFGHHLPDISAFVLSLNPTAHANVHDGRLAGLFVEHLNASLQGGAPLFDDHRLPSLQGLPAYEAKDPGHPVALLTSYTPNIACYASISERNLSSYAARHGYTHHIYRDLPASLQGQLAGNWIKPQLLLRHLKEHQQVAWVDADILIHRPERPLDSIMRGHPVALARDISGHAFNSGFMVFSQTPECLAYLERVQAMIDEVHDKKGVYASGGDQTFFVSAWHEAGGVAAMPLSDCVSFNSHPALYDDNSFMLHYMGYADRFRTLVMHEDARRIELRYA